MLPLNSIAPAFTAEDQSGKIQNLSDYIGQWVLLYFYPKDNTPGCTVEACSLKDNYNDFKKVNAVVLGVSKDSVKSHAGFAKKFSLPFTIISDPEKKIINLYEVTSRVSYLINPKGIIAVAYDKVKPAEHATQVLNDIKALSK